MIAAPYPGCVSRRHVACKRFVAAGVVELTWIMAHLAGMISAADAKQQRAAGDRAEGKEAT
jgi:hypothetical protein